ncbi:CDP-alcohol phosphatidyltransferase family protein [Patescibacteria group bacterium AH-259-L07]|nr:CDP-alcohol phosphatidyltransferase family protein [Patescibacteria group bacterium AH-259-L07]
MKKVSIKDIVIYDTHHYNNNPLKLLYEPLAIPISYLLVRYTNILPNTITILSLVFGLFAALFNFFSIPYWPALLFYIAYLLDFVDGKMARTLGTTSAFGKRFDILVDRLIFSALSLSYIYIFLSSERSTELFLFSSYIFLFFYIDIIEYSGKIFRYMKGEEISQPGKNTDRTAWYKTFTDLKLWIPKRTTTLPIVFVFSPLFGYYQELYILSILILVLVMISYLTQAVKKLFIKKLRHHS